ncbi:CotH kinase family protein [Lewinella sp. IMCC34191]|uniref:CotH kinase family protein n=1 Tax=Lewinella sp. IMCC34191 TaxID=2259172 RepID=UPI000E2281AE|nr:CotH kinase family protein [Lewinella sp. IMCC34191]
MRLPYLLLLIVFGSGIFSQSLLTVDPLRVGLDEEAAFLLIHQNLNGLADVPDAIRVGEIDYAFDPSPDLLRYNETYRAISSSGDSVDIAFTSLPLFQVASFYELNNETKVPSVIRYADDEQAISAIAGIEYRGGLSLGYPKKSLDLEFWDNATNRESVDIQFTGLRVDDDWVLDALYNEPMRVNAYVAHELWLDWHQPYYIDREPDARSGADVTFVEVFFQDQYHGVYLLSEQVDRKQLGLKKLKDGALRGELYKAVDWTDATLFKGQPPRPGKNQATYSGWELKYPDEDDLIDWDPLYGMLGFVKNTSDVDFSAGIAERFHLGNLVDYMLYINVAALFDNSGKNTYLARYDQSEPYFYAPWDLDGSFGNFFDGSRAEFGDFWLSNGLLDRIIALNPDDFNQRMCDRYRSLRSGILATDSLLGRIDEARLLLESNGVFARENKRWGNARHDAEQIAFTKEFVTRRLAYLDEYVCLLSSVDEASSDHSWHIFPNPTAGYLTVRTTLLGQPTPYRIVDLLGRTLLSGELRAAEERLDLSGVRPGVYFIQVFDRLQRFVVADMSSQL